MTQNTRKLVGTFVTLAALVLYCVLATAIYLAVFQGQHQIVMLTYFAVAGVAWCVPAAVIIKWMAKPDPQ